MKEIISWISFCVILFAYGFASLYCGILSANWFVDFFNLRSWWCLLGIFPLFIVGGLVAAFLVLGLKRFGEK